MRTALLLLAVASGALAQEAEIQRAVMELDQRTVEFAARLKGAPLVDLQRLENAFARQRLEVLTEPVAPALRHYQREAAARENEGYVLQLAPPVERSYLPSARRPCSVGSSEGPCLTKRGSTLLD